jgi:hypothetical protein
MRYLVAPFVPKYLMRILLLLTCLVASITLSAQGPNRELAEKEFLKTLQEALEIGIDSTPPGDPICSIDTAFAIDDNGILSLTLRFKNQDKDSSFYLQRYAVPLRLVSHVFYDIYIGLESYNDAIYVRRTKKNTTMYNQYALTNLWHLGMLPEDKAKELQPKLYALVRELRRWYH